MYTDNEIRELLAEAFSKGYDDGIDDTLDYIDENYELESDDSFDLEEEYDSYTESKNVREQYKARRIESPLGATYKVKKGYNYRRDGDSSGRYDRENNEYSISKDDGPTGKSSATIGRIKVYGNSNMPSKKIRNKIDEIKWKKELEDA